MGRYGLTETEDIASLATTPIRKSQGKYGIDVEEAPGRRGKYGLNPPKTQGLIKDSSRPYESAWSGPLWSDILSGLGVGGMAVAGGFHRQRNIVQNKNLSPLEKAAAFANPVGQWKGITSGIAKGRTVYGELAATPEGQEFERQHPTAAKALFMAADIGLDPLNFVPVAGVLGVGGKLSKLAKAGKLGKTVQKADVLKDAARTALYTKTRYLVASKWPDKA